MPEIGPGLHRDLPFADYAAVKAVNSGVVKWGIESSMRHMHDALSGRLDSSDTESRKFGRAVHCRLLEPERYGTDVLVSTKCAAQKAKGGKCTNPGKYLDDAERWYCGMHATEEMAQPVDYVDFDEHTRIEAMAAALHEHPALAIARRTGWSEVAVVGELCGVLCKGRLDRVPEELDIIIDVKKCGVGKASDEACMTAIANWGYHRQAAMYVDLLRPHHPLGMSPRFAWVFIEDGYPYRPNVIFADDETLECGRWEVEQVLTQYKRCQQLGSFPDYMPDPRRPFVGGLPAWYRKTWLARKSAMEAA